MFWLLCAVVLAAFAWKQVKTEVGTVIQVSDIERSIQSHLSDVKSGSWKLEGLSLKTVESDFAVKLDLRGQHLGNEVKVTATVFGTPGYGAVRGHMTFTPKKVALEEMQTLGKSTGPVSIKNDRRDGSKGLDAELGRVVETAFATIKAHELGDGVTSHSWLNSAKVEGDKVVVKWDKVQTTTTSILVIVAVIVFLFFAFYCPEILFFWMIIAS